MDTEVGRTAHYMGVHREQAGHTGLVPPRFYPVATLQQSSEYIKYFTPITFQLL